jgi:hypothetical protein
VNHLTLCGKVINSQILHNSDGKPFCRLTLKYKWNDGKEKQYSTIAVEYYNTSEDEDKIFDIDTQCDGQFVIVQGSFENYKTEDDSYHVALIGRGYPLLLEKFIPINRIALCGRLGRDPKLTEFRDGSMVAKVSLATQRTKDSSSWHNVDFWGRNAQKLDTYCSKGSLIGVSGQLQWYLPRDRVTGAYLKEGNGIPFVRAEQLTLLGSSNNSSQREEDF